MKSNKTEYFQALDGVLLRDLINDFIINNGLVLVAVSPFQLGHGVAAFITYHD